MMLWFVASLETAAPIGQLPKTIDILNDTVVYGVN
jgi:hypothetical protein